MNKTAIYHLTEIQRDFMLMPAVDVIVMTV